jgi:hypothetical protein
MPDQTPCSTKGRPQVTGEKTRTLESDKLNLMSAFYDLCDLEQITYHLGPLIFSSIKWM